MSAPLLVNDVHAQLNATRVERIVTPTSRDEIGAVVRAARQAGARLAVSGGRHAMGGQQFGTDAWLIDLRQHAGIRAFDRERGLLTVDAGIQWPELIAGYLARQNDSAGGPHWGIRQKQTGADRLTLGGALAANVHGRGLQLQPIVDDVEAFTLIDAHGESRRCSRAENPDLFRLAIGGYGLFGIIADVTLRLAPRLKLERRVAVVMLDEVMELLQERRAPEWLYGDFQYAIDERSPDFLRRGVFSCYRRVADDTPMPAEQRELSAADWERLIYLAHTDRARAFREYCDYYLTTDGQHYWSDTHQLSVYLDNYHAALDRRLGAPHPGSEMISELYVPRPALVRFMAAAAELLRAGAIPVIYGTIRLIERDRDTFLAWAREPWACVIFNLHLEHTPVGLAAGQAVFRGLIDLAASCQGSYYLTYHRWATRQQVEACHPRFRAFLECKAAHDPAEVFSSDWYRHQRALFDLS
jgi:FAD/FMN-containing dehydrogenase